MKSNLVWHALWACVSVGLAFVAWQKPLGWDEERTVYVLDARAPLLTQVQYRGSEHTVVLSKHIPNPTIEILSAQKESTGVYPLVEQGQELWDQFLPLKASRDLGVVTAERLDAFGLAQPKAHVVVKTEEKEHVFALGGNTYGSGDVYLKRADGHVFLVKAGLVNPLRFSPSSLQDKTMLKVSLPEIERIKIIRETHTEEYVQRFAEQPEKAFFAKAASPQQEDTRISLAVKQLLHTHMDALDTKKPSGPPSLIVEFLGNQGVLEKMQLWKPAGDVLWGVSQKFPQGMRVSSEIYSLF